MKNTIISASLLGVLLAGCTAGQVAVPPKQTPVDVSAATNRLQFAVGTATVAGLPAPILNTVVTWRQPNGLDGTLLDTPTITGPTGFVNNGVLAVGAIDAGTNTISGSPQIVLGTPALVSTLGTAGGAFGYGFLPINSVASSNAPGFGKYSLPLAAPAAQPVLQYQGGPPTYTNPANPTGNFRDGTFPAGFAGYAMGFTDFAVTPVSGVYNLSLVVPTGFDINGNPQTTTVTSASNALNAAFALPAFPTPTFVPDGAGGGTVNLVVPAGVTEAVAIVRNGTGGCYPGANGAPAYFTLRTTATGPVSLTLPANLGPTYATQTSTRTLCTGDKYTVYAVGFDYPAFAAGPPNNRQQAPVILGAGGQSDITTSAALALTY